MASVKVAVRVRPFSQRETDMDAKLIIQMSGKTTGILNCKANARDESIRYKEFTFDYSYWSHGDDAANHADQEQVYKDLGTEVVDCAFEGYNACVFAYGQTGSGKTFTMMGSHENQGLIPRICKALFERMSEDSKRGTTHRVQVSYLEIYQERVADLLRGRDSTSLKVREHPKKGPYVQGLTTCLVTNYGHIQECMDRGNSNRTTAATNMNDVSSRSHAIFTITFVQAGYCDGVPSETVSKIHLVDLAGSERADATGATGQRLKEGAHINKSLVTLGSVISALAELPALEAAGHRRAPFIPYRDSVLTWLLKDSLGGNSKTIMIAAISPADCNYGETLSTLRYANRAKNIINKPTVNEDANVKLIRELRDEIAKLRALMFKESRWESERVLAQLQEKEAREKELTQEWAGKWREAQAILREQRALGLRKAGPGVVLDSDRPHLVAIDDDPLSTGVTLYHLREGVTEIGSDSNQDIVLRGPGMEGRHCAVSFEDGVASVHPRPGAQVWLNSVVIDAPARLSQGAILFLGRAHVFRFNDPAEAARLRSGGRADGLSRLSLLSWSTPDLASSTENLQPLGDEEKEADKTEIANQRLSLVKEKEDLEREQEEFEKRRRSLEEAQARLEAEKRDMEREHAEQARQLQENWRHLTAQQKARERELLDKEQQLIRQREELELERCRFLKELEDCFSQGQELASQLQAAPKRPLSDLNAITLPHKDLLPTSSPCSGGEFLSGLLDGAANESLLQELIGQHRHELAQLRAELQRRVRLLSEGKAAVATMDRQIVGLVDEQIELISETRNDEDLRFLRRTLTSRTEQQLKELDLRKQSLTLDLKRINSAQSCPDSLELNYDEDSSTNSLSFGGKTTFSSDTYHTAASSCSTQFVDGIERLMSDSGVELRPPSSKKHDESDISSSEDYKADSQSSSSVENRSPTLRKRRRDSLNRLGHRIAQQKLLILKGLDSQMPKAYLDSQIAVLQDMQRQYMVLKTQGASRSALSPALEHPLQHQESMLDLDSPSPVRPVQTGSTSALYSPTLPLHKQQSSSYIMYSSMPSIVTETDTDSVVSIGGFYLRGTGTKTHYEYEIRITAVDDRWSVLRRYSRFRDLHLAMKTRYGDVVSKIPFPPRQLFSNTEAVARGRKKQLQAYLRRLIEACQLHPNCPLAYGAGVVTRAALLQFSPFFRKGLFENGKYGTG